MTARKPDKKPAKPTKKAPAIKATLKKVAAPARKKPVPPKPKESLNRDPKGVVERYKRTAGQPTLYDAEAHCELAAKFSMLGTTNEQLAQALGIGLSTLEGWMARHPEFSSAIKSGREIADARVAGSLYHRATGYEHPEDDIRAMNGAIVITPTVKHYPPDTTAAIFWLKNRRADLWRDRVDTTVTGANGGPVQVHSTVTFVRAPLRDDEDDA
jgi:hypothetical protein